MRVIRFRSIWSSILPAPALAILLASCMAQTTIDSAQAAASARNTESEDNSEPERAPQQQPQPQSPGSQRQRAEQELKQQEQQRILGVIPNFNSTDVENAAPLTPRQKFRLAFRSAIDPFQFVAAAGDAGISQARNDFAGYGQGAQGYAKRFGAAYTDQFSGFLWSGAIFPVLLKEDPRYFRRGRGSFKSRLFYSIGTTLWAKRDSGSWGPNYANVLGNMAAGSLANFYYPSTDRGVGLTFQRALTVIAEGTLGAVFIEFWPDISSRVFHRQPAQSSTTGPAAK